MKNFLIILLMFPFVGFAQKEAKFIRKGNQSYETGNFKEAEVNYRKSLDVNQQSLKGNFNLGDALYNQKDYEGSQKIFDKLSKKFENKDQRAEAFYNLGNSFLSTKKYKESIEAYKNALRNNPSDKETRYNLEYAKQKLILQKQKNQQNKKNKKKDKNKDQNKKNEKNQKDKQDKNQGKQDQKDQQQNKDKPKKQQSQPKQISKQDAERMLKALKNDEKKTIEKLKKLKAKSVKTTVSEKDW